MSDVVGLQVSGYLNLFANVVDNFTHGLAVGGSFLVSRRVSTPLSYATQILGSRVAGSLVLWFIDYNK